MGRDMSKNVFDTHMISKDPPVMKYVQVFRYITLYATKTNKSISGQ